MQALFGSCAVLIALAVIFNNILTPITAQRQRFSKNLPNITASHFRSHCIKCRCMWNPGTGCNVNVVSTSDCDTCGPLYFTVWAWQDAKLPEFSKAANWNSTYKMQEFRKCVTKLDCATRTALFYANEFKKDCNGDGKFDCFDALLINMHGPGGCGNYLKNSTAFPDYTKHNQCYNESTNDAHNHESHHDTLILVVKVLVPILVLVAVGGAVGGWWYQRWKRRQMARYPRGSRIKRTGTLGQGPLQIPVSAIIPPSELHIENSAPIGEGQFGKVYRGTYNNTLVAIKAPKVDATNSTLIADLKKELEMMSRLGDHEFVVKFFGAEVSGIRRGEAYIVMEFSLYGALVDYLRRHSPKPKSGLDPADDSKEAEESSTFSTSTQLLWTEQIATGMAFLESKCLLHGDLAARNVLVFNRELVKISDFGFARHLGNYEFYQKKEIALPWRWMPPECLKQRLFSIKSDVWSFAVTAWEIFTYGTVPYLEFPSWSLDFITHLTDGRYLSKPPDMPQHLYSICLQCWSLYPNRRPSFATLQHHFRQLRTYGEVRPNDYELVAGASGTNVKFTVESV